MKAILIVLYFIMGVGGLVLMIASLFNNNDIAFIKGLLAVFAAHTFLHWEKK